MANKIYGFADEESFRRVKEATRRVLGSPTTGAQQRRQSPVIIDVPQLGKADANIAGRTSGTISLWKGPFGEEEDSTKNVEAFNMSDVQADEGAWVRVENTAHGIGFLPVECPA